jgi:hypothetical protein
MIRHLAWAGLALLGGAAVAQDAAQPSIAESDAILIKSVRSFADITLMRGAPGGGTDMVIILGRNASGAVVLTGFATVASQNARMPLDSNALAIVRARTKNAARKAAPDAEDMQFAAQQTAPVFIAGAWKKPAQIWQVDAHGAPRRFRTVDGAGTAGTWQELP